MKNFTLIFLSIISLSNIVIANNSAEFPYIQPISVESLTPLENTIIDDDDGDGIANSEDKCLNTPSNVTVDISGCKLYLDDDKDGVSNRDDKCPKSKLDVAVNIDGCQPDADMDGVIDAKDECPDTSKDFIVDNKGCPQTTVLKIEFASADYKILAQSMDEIEAFANFLHDNMTYQIIIYGYTDNINNTGNNKQLSRDRANAVMEALIDYGIKLTRLTAIGMGSKNPIADNSTQEGRMKNRRIEVELLQ